MVDVSSVEGRILLQQLRNGTRILDSVESGKVVYAVNERTENSFEISFTKLNGSSYKGVLTRSDNLENSKEFKILTNGKPSMVFCESVITLLFKDNQLHIIAPEEIKFYE